MEKKNKKKKFKLFDMNRDGKGVEPGEDRTPNLKFFFKQFWRKLPQIISVNLLMIFQALPIVISVLLIFASPMTPVQSNAEYAALHGISTFSSDAVANLSSALSAYQMQGLMAYNTYVYWIIIPLMLFLFVTFGWQNVGATYVMRGLVRGDAVFVWSDYFYGIKKNLKQGFILGVIDFLAIGILALDISIYINSPVTMMNNIMYSLSVALIIIYIMFRFYIYLQIITFNISIFKAMKNSLKFIILGIKRNLMALLGIFIITAIAVLMIVLLLPLGLGVVIILPFLYYLGFYQFITTYAAYPVIKKYMIDPPQKSNEE